MNLYKGRKLPACVPVYDHGDAVLYYADRDKAVLLMEHRMVEVIGTKHRIQGLRLIGPDPALLPGPIGRKPQLGMPHRHENYDNVRGMWTIDRIPRHFEPEFQCVLQKAA